jgi:hypothetical protein
VIIRVDFGSIGPKIRIERDFFMNRNGSAGFFVVAAGGHGMMCGPGLGLAMAELVATGAVADLPADEIRLDRFAAGAAAPSKDQIALPFPAEA